MKPPEYIPAIEKFIEGIFIPKFPEIEDFLVQANSRSDGEEGGYVYIIFYTKGKRQSWFHNRLHHTIKQMKTYLSIPESITLYYDINKGKKSS